MEGLRMMVGLPERGVVKVAGEDRVKFLQGLVSNDVTLAAPGRAVWAALLTPQGKYLADFFVIAEDEALLLDCERAQAAMLVALFGRYKLRSRISLQDRSDELRVHVAWDTAPVVDAIVVRDPRHAEAGWRVISAATLPDSATEADWHRHRIALGLPDGTRDLEAEKSVLLEAGFDELGGVSWNKGCYMGQELTARTKYRGLVKRRLVPVRVMGALPDAGTPILRDGEEVGTLRFGVDGIAMALLRVEAIGAGSLTCGEAMLSPLRPEWMVG
jgi:folate-binding protein YgfZ